MRHPARVALLASAAALAMGCFGPDYPENLPCDVDGWCPPGQACNAQSICVAAAADAGTDGDGPVDAVPFDAADMGRLLSISIGDDVTLTVNEKHQFVVTATYELGTTTVTDWVIWQSSSTEVAWVDYKGLCTAESAGEATITADYEGRVDQALVTVQ